MTEIAPQPKPFSQKPFRIAREASGAAQTREALAAEVTVVFGARDEEIVALAARDEAGGWIGGINGVIHWRWFYIAQFFVAPGWRGQGLGRSLLTEAEDLAREKNCVGLYLDTFSPRALAFYRANSFEIAGKIGDFPPGATRTFLFRALKPASA
jgi:GNAT superfamily N-acetyltransferase